MLYSLNVYFVTVISTKIENRDIVLRILYLHSFFTASNKYQWFKCRNCPPATATAPLPGIVFYIC